MKELYFRLNRASPGMTLVEVMVALGISSIVLVGVLELVTLSNKSARNVTILSDWSSIISSVRLVLNDENLCSSIFKGQYAYTAAGTTGTFTPPLVKLQSTGTGFTFLDNSPTAYQTFALTGIIPYNVTGPKTIQMPDPLVATQLDNYYQYTVNFSFTGTKKGNGANGGSSLGGNSLTTTVPATVNIVTGPISVVSGGSIPAGTLPNIIYGCGSVTSLAEVCGSLGGIYNPSPTYPGETQCVLRQIQFFGGATDPATMISGAGFNGMAGERVQLFGVNGATTPSPSDYAIGINSQAMWFNIGGAGNGLDHWNGATLLAGAGVAGQPNYNQFLWNSRPDVLGGASNSGNVLMELDAGANLLIDPEDKQATPRLSFGGKFNGSGTIVAGAPTEFISSYRSNGGSPMAWAFGLLGDLNFNTNGQNRLDILHNGTVLISPTDAGYSTLQVGGLFNGTQIQGCPSSNTTCDNAGGLTFANGVGPVVAIQGKPDGVGGFVGQGSLLVLPADDGLSRVAFIGSAGFGNGGGSLGSAPAITSTNGTGDLSLWNNGVAYMTLQPNGGGTNFTNFNTQVMFNDFARFPKGLTVNGQLNLGGPGKGGNVPFNCHQECCNPNTGDTTGCPAGFAAAGNCQKFISPQASEIGCVNATDFVISGGGVCPLTAPMLTSAYYPAQLWDVTCAGPSYPVWMEVTCCSK